MTVADRFGKYDACGLGSIGEISRGDSSGVVSGEPKPCGDNDISESSGDRRDEDEEEVAELRSGAL